MLDAVELYSRYYEADEHQHHRDEDKEEVGWEGSLVSRKSLFATSRGCQTSGEEWRMLSEPSTAPWECAVLSGLRVLAVAAATTTNSNGSSSSAVAMQQEQLQQREEQEQQGLAAVRAVLGATWGTAHKRQAYHLVRSAAKHLLRKLCQTTLITRSSSSNGTTSTSKMKEVKEKKEKKKEQKPKKKGEDEAYSKAKDIIHLSRLRLLLSSPSLTIQELSAIVKLLQHVLTRRPSHLYLGSEGGRKEGGMEELWVQALVRRVLTLHRGKEDRSSSRNNNSSSASRDLEIEKQQEQWTVAREVVAFGMRELGAACTAAAATIIPRTGVGVEDVRVLAGVDALVRLLDSSSSGVSAALGLSLSSWLEHRVNKVRMKHKKKTDKAAKKRREQRIAKTVAPLYSTLVSIAESIEGEEGREGGEGGEGREGREGREGKSLSCEADTKKEGLDPPSETTFPSSSSPSSPGASLLVYVCDRCQSSPLPSGRYHCRVCRDVDLCEACYKAIHLEGGEKEGEEVLEEHSSSHLMVFIDVNGVEGGREIHRWPRWLVKTTEIRRRRRRMTRRRRERARRRARRRAGAGRGRGDLSFFCGEERSRARGTAEEKERGAGGRRGG